MKFSQGIKREKEKKEKKVMIEQRSDINKQQHVHGKCEKKETTVEQTHKDSLGVERISFPKPTIRNKIKTEETETRQQR